MRSQLVLSDLSFSYDTSPSPLFQGLQVHLGPGWTGVVGPNGSGKTTLLLLATGILHPNLGRVHRGGRAIYCPQRTDDPPADLEAILSSDDPAAARLRAVLGLDEDWAERWVTLSHGERKRAQIASALTGEPDLLAVDEPTNHLDGEARQRLEEALRSFRGVGLLVSHDRDLLDRLCARCLFLEPPAARVRPGGYTAGSEVERREREAGRARYVEGVRKARSLHREVVRRREEASRADRRKSKCHLDRHDTDAKGKIDLAIFTGKDGQAGRLARQLQGREVRARAALRQTWVPAERKLRFWMPGSTYRGDWIARLESGRLALGASRVLSHPDLEIRPGDRIALTGPNGSGKTTLLRRVVDRLAIPPERAVVLPQEIDQAETRALTRRMRGLDTDRRGHLMTVIAALGSEPERILSTDLPSPGETRKILLGLGVVGDPWLVVMDEPTNHLDLPSIELLERALRGCPCALVVVSHDRRFVDSLECGSWRMLRAEWGWRLVL